MASWLRLVVYYSRNLLGEFLIRKTWKLSALPLTNMKTVDRCLKSTFFFEFSTDSTAHVRFEYNIYTYIYIYLSELVTIFQSIIIPNPLLFLTPEVTRIQIKSALHPNVQPFPFTIAIAMMIFPLGFALGRDWDLWTVGLKQAGSRGELNRWKKTDMIRVLFFRDVDVGEKPSGMLAWFKHMNIAKMETKEVKRCGWFFNALGSLCH